MKLIFLTLFCVFGLINSATIRHGSRGSEEGVRDILKDLCSNSADDLTQDIPEKFTSLVHALREIEDGSVIDRLYREVKSGSLCPRTEKLGDFFRDALVLGGTEGSIKKMVNLILSNEFSDSKANYGLTMLAFVPEPTPDSIKQLIPLLEQTDKQILRQSLLGVSAFVYNYCRNLPSGKCQNVKVVDQIVNIIGKHLSSSQEDVVIVSLKALKNIGSTTPTVLDKALTLASDKTRSNAVRVAALESLVPLSKEKKVYTKSLEILQDLKNDSEIRINAYKVLIADEPESYVVDQIFKLLEKEDSKQVGSYIVSSLKNIKESKTPEQKTLRDSIAEHELPLNKFPSDWRKFSRNFRMSNVYSSYDVGTYVQGDLIYNQNTFLPTSGSVEVGLPLFGSKVSLFGLGGRQVNLQKLLEKVGSPAGLLSKKNYPEVLNEIIDYLKEMASVSENEIRTRRSYPRRMSNLENSIDSHSLEASVYLDFDGKTIFYLESNDIKNFKVDSLRDVMAVGLKKAEKVLREGKTDRAFSLMFLDINRNLKLQRDSSVNIDVNGTIVASFKNKENSLFPSFAVEISAKVGPDAKNNRPGLKWTNNILSSPSLKTELEYSNGVPMRVLFSLPKEKMTLFSYRSRVWKIDQNNREIEIVPRRNIVHSHCSETEKLFGSKLCFDHDTPVPFFNYDTPILPLNGGMSFELNLLKTDKSMKGYEFTLRLPKKTDTKKVFLIGFNTPDSSINRENHIELELTSSRDGMDTRLEIVSPIKSLEIKSNYKYTKNDALAHLELNIMKSGKYLFEASFKTNSNNRKTTFEPKLLIQVPEMKPMKLEGSIMLDNPNNSKPKIMIDLYTGSASARTAYIKGDITRDGSVSTQKFKFSSNFEGDLKVLKFKLFSVNEKTPEKLNTDLNIDYELRNSEKHTLKVLSKLNKQKNTIIKYNNLFQIKSTQFPLLNMNAEYAYSHKLKEFMENDLTLKWSSNKSVHIAHKSVFNDNTGEHKVLIEGKPWGFRNEINFSREIRIGKSFKQDIKFEEKLELPNRSPYHYTIEYLLQGERYSESNPQFKLVYSLNDKTTDKSAIAQFEYKHMQKKPLKFSIDALVQLFSGKKISYNDRLEETKPNEYKGKTILTWSPAKKAELDYIYRMKSDKNQYEIDVNLRTPSLTIKHDGLLKLTRDNLVVKSNHYHDGRQIYSADFDLSPVKKSQVSLIVANVDTKVEANPWGNVKSGSLVITHPKFVHDSNLLVNFESNSGTLNSKTTVNGKPIYSLSSNIKPKEKSNLVFTAGKLKVNGEHQRKPKSNYFYVDLNTNDLFHSTKLNHQRDSLSVISKTRNRSNQKIFELTGDLNRNGLSLLNLEGNTWTVNGQVNPTIKHFKLVAEKPSKNFKHSTEVKKEQNWSVASSTKYNNINYYNMKSNLDTKGSLSTLSVDLPRINYNLDVKVTPVRRSGEVALKMYNYEHKMNVNKDRNTLNIEASSTNKGSNVGKLTGKFSYDEPSSLKMTSVKYGQLNFDLVPSRQAKLEVNDKVHNLFHSTTLTNEPNVFALISQTDKNGKKYLINGNLKNSEGSLNLEGFDCSGKLQYTSDRNKMTVKSEMKTMRGDKHQANLVASLNEPSSFEYQGKSGSIVAYINPMGKAKSADLKVNLNRVNLEHTSSLNQESNKYTLNSKTMWNKENIYNLRSEIEPRMRSAKLNLDTKMGSGSVNYNKNELLEVKLNNDNFDHFSTIKRENGLKIDSRSNYKNSNLYTLNSRISRSAPSNVDISAKRFDGSIKVDVASPLKSLKLTCNCKKSSRYHKSEILYTPREKLDIDSLTRDSYNNEYKLKSTIDRNNGFINYLDKRNKMNVKIVPIGSRKSIEIELNTPRVNLIHETKVNRDRRSIESETKLNNVDYKLKADLDETKPVLTIDTPALEGTIEGQLSKNEKSMKMNLKTNLRNRERRITGSLKKISGPKHMIESKLNWDADRRTDSELSLLASHEVQGKSWGKKTYLTTLKGEMTPKLRLSWESQFTNDLKHGQHKIDLTTKCDRDENKIHFEHEITPENTMLTRLTRESLRTGKKSEMNLEVNPNELSKFELKHNNDFTIVASHEVQGQRYNKKYLTSFESEKLPNYRLSWNSEFSSDLKHGPHKVDLITKCPKGENKIHFNHEMTSDRKISTTLTRESDKSNKKSEFTLRIEPNKLSKIQLKHDQTDAQIEYLNKQPLFNGKMFFKNSDYEHETKFDKSNEKYNFETKSTKNGRSIVDGSMTIPRMSTFDDSNPLDAQFNYKNEKKAILKMTPRKLTVNLDTDKVNIEHESTLDLNRDSYNFNSISKKNGIELANFDGEFIKNQRANYKLYLNDKQFEHGSEWRRSGKKDEIKSTTKKSNKLMYSWTTTYEPRKINIDLECQHGKHNTDIKYDDAVIVLKSETKAPSVNIKLDAQLNKLGESKVHYIDDYRTVKGSVKPFGPSKAFTLKVNGRNVNLDHESTLDYDSDKVVIKSNSDLNNKKIYLIQGDLRRNKQSINVESKYLTGKINSNLNNEKNNVDWDLKVNMPKISDYERRLKGSVETNYNRQGGSFKTNLALDDKNIDATGSYTRSSTIKSKLNVRVNDRHHYDLDSEISRDLVYGPHRVTAKQTTPRVNREIQLNHEIKSNKMNCLVNVKENSRDIVLLNSMIVPKGKSSIKAKAFSVEGDATYDYKKSGSLNVKGSDFSHISEFLNKNGEYVISSNTLKNHRNLLSMSSTIKPRTRSEINFKSGDIEGDAVYESRKSVIVNFKKPNYSHTSSIVAENDQLYINSETKKNNAVVAKVESKLSRRSISNGEIRLPQGTGKFEINPGKQYKLNINSRNLVHETLLRKERSLLVNSNTKLNNEVIADIQGDFQKDQSSLKIHTPRGYLNSDYKKGDLANLEIHVKDMKKYFERSVNTMLQKIKNKCDYRSLCHQLIRKYERYGLEGVKAQLYDMMNQHYEKVMRYVEERMAKINSRYSRYMTTMTREFNRQWDQYVAPLKEKYVVQVVLNSLESLVEGLNNLKDKSIDMIMSFESANDLIASLYELYEDSMDELDNLYRANLNSDDSVLKYNVNGDNVVLKLDLKKRLLLKKDLPPSFYKTHAIIKENINSLASQINLARATIKQDWLPPFQTSAMIIGGQHFITFDRKFYDFAGSDCTYLLSRDFHDGNFTVMVKYEKPEQRTNEIRKSLLVNINNFNVEINTKSNSVKLNDKFVDLPLKLKGVTVLRTDSAIVVDDKRGVELKCFLDQDICALSMTGWYFGKTAGLFGSYDYERYNDMTGPNGDFHKSANSFASSWLVKDTCRSENVVRTSNVPRLSKGYQLCESLFKSSDSPLVSGFSFVKPDEMFELCIRHVSATSKYMSEEKSTCTVAAAYKKLLENEGYEINLPSRCFTCENNMEYGTRSMRTESRNNKVDVVFVVEEHECNRHLIQDIGVLAKTIEKEMKFSGYSDVRFGVAGYGNEENDVHYHTARSNIMFPASDILLATEKMNFRERSDSSEKVDIYQSIVFGSQYPFRPTASKNIILMACSPCKEEVMKHDYSTIQQMLLNEGITMHILNDKPIEIRNQKARGVYAVDAKSVFRSRDVTQRTLVGSPEIRSSVRPPKDVCIALAQESSGSYFYTGPYTSNSEPKQWRTILARRITDSSRPPTCVNCYCNSSNSGYTPKTSCRPCQTRSPMSRFWL